MDCVWWEGEEGMGKGMGRERQTGREGKLEKGMGGAKGDSFENMQKTYPSQIKAE